MMARHSGADPVHVLAAAVSAVVGGTVAIAVLQFFDIQQPNALAGMALILIVAAVIAIVTSLTVARTPSGPPLASSSAPKYPNSPPPSYHWGSATPPAGRPDGGAAQLPGERAQTTDGAAGLVSTPTWWTVRPPGGTMSSPRTAPLPADPTAEPRAASSEYPGVKRVVQCPECGDFRIDITHQPPVFHFGCRRCAHSWTWQRGTDWPRTMIRPRRGTDRTIVRAPQR